MGPETQGFVQGPFPTGPHAPVTAPPLPSVAATLTTRHLANLSKLQLSLHASSLTELASASLAASPHISLFTVRSYPGCRAAQRKQSREGGRQGRSLQTLAGWLADEWTRQSYQSTGLLTGEQGQTGWGGGSVRGADAANGHSSPDQFQLKAISAVTAAMIIVFIIQRNKPPARPWPGL